MCFPDRFQCVYSVCVALPVLVMKVSRLPSYFAWRSQDSHHLHDLSKAALSHDLEKLKIFNF